MDGPDPQPPTSWRLNWMAPAIADYRAEETDREGFDWDAVDAEDARRSKDYARHVRALCSQLPTALLPFAALWLGDESGLNVHDGLVESWGWASGADEDGFELQFLCK